MCSDIFYHLVKYLVWVYVNFSVKCLKFVPKCFTKFFLFCLVFAMSLCASVYMCFAVTCWERTDLLALVCGVLLWVCHSPIGILGQVWYLIVLIPDLCTLTYLLLFQLCFLSPKSYLTSGYDIIFWHDMICLFDLILYVPSTIFQLNRDGSSLVEPTLS